MFYSIFKRTSYRFVLGHYLHEEIFFQFSGISTEQFCSYYREPRLSLTCPWANQNKKQYKLILPLTARNCARLCDLLAVRPFPQIAQKTLSFLHSTEREKVTKMMIIFKTPAILVCFMRHDPIKPQTFVQRLAHTRKVTTCCCLDLYETVTCCQLLVHAQFQIM